MADFAAPTSIGKSTGKGQGYWTRKGVIEGGLDGSQSGSAYSEKPDPTYGTSCVVGGSSEAGGLIGGSVYGTIINGKAYRGTSEGGLVAEGPADIPNHMLERSVDYVDNGRKLGSGRPAPAAVPAKPEKKTKRQKKNEDELDRLEEEPETSTFVTLTGPFGEIGIECFHVEEDAEKVVLAFRKAPSFTPKATEEILELLVDGSRHAIRVIYTGIKFKIPPVNLAFQVYLKEA